MSLAARSLWAKKGKNGMWLPLITHMQDALFIASNLWNEWVSIGIKSRITRDIGIDEAEKLFLFLAAIHDLGKATPLFQSTPVYPIDRTLDECVWDNLRFAGLPMRSAKEFINRGKTPHALASQVLLEAAGCNRNVASIVGAHHGKPQTNHRIDARGLLAYALNYHLGQSGKDVWRAVQTEIINLALALSGFESLDGLPIPDLPNQLLLSGLLIMTDWIVSNEKYFPYLHIEQSTINVDIFERTHLAWDNLSLPPPWRISVNVDDVDLFAKRFGFTKANAMQLLALKVASSIQKPGIIVIEAPMGNGKTEAALVCAEVLADVTKRGGVYFALPTQATSDAIFPRILRWIENLGANDPHSVNLAHGKAQFNQDFENLKGFEGSTNVGNDDDGDGSLFVHEWFEGRKRTMLSDFVVGTIDQFLLAALKQKHLMLRHLGLAQKVIIIDECHAYDVYMGQYLERALQWFGAYRTPVIVLSATLPTAKRKALINAYLNVNESRDEETDLFGNTIRRGDQRVKWTVSQDYPIITYTDGMEVYQQALQTKGRTQSVHMYFLNDELIIETLETLLSQGGCAGLIVNTVGRAQAVAKELRDHFGNDVVNLFHSRFLITDRVAKEKELVATLGAPRVGRRRPHFRIDVGTQVLEQSLDIDFDVLLVDIAPMDLLLQRIGRLHRHHRDRPQGVQFPTCFVLGCTDDDYGSGSKAIYGEYLLKRTHSLIPEIIHLPSDIAQLVNKTYEGVEDQDSGFEDNMPDQILFKAHQTSLAIRKERAKKYRLGPVWPGAEYNLLDLLERDLSEQHGEAAVRDTYDSVEVLAVQDCGNGRFGFLTGKDRRTVRGNDRPSRDMGKMIAQQRLNLPRILCHPGAIDATIRELEETNRLYLADWQECSWLKGELVLVFDQNGMAVLNGVRLTYTEQDGLLYVKEECTNGVQKI